MPKVLHPIEVAKGDEKMVAEWRAVGEMDSDWWDEHGRFWYIYLAINKYIYIYIYLYIIYLYTCWILLDFLSSNLNRTEPSWRIFFGFIQLLRNPTEQRITTTSFRTGFYGFFFLSCLSCYTTIIMIICLAKYGTTLITWVVGGLEPWNLDWLSIQLGIS